MEEEFQGGSVCGGNWWNSSRNLFGSSLCSSAVNDLGWLNHAPVTDIKTGKSISSDDSAGSASDGILQTLERPQQLHQMMGITLSTTDNWNNQDFVHDSGRSKENYSHMIQASSGLNSTMDFHQKPDFSADSSITTFQELSAGFPLNSNYLQTWFDTESQLDNQATNYSYQTNSNEFLVKPSLSKQLPPNHLQFINNTPFWNATAAASDDLRPSFLPSTQHQFIPSSLDKAKHHNEKADSVAKKVSNEPAFKRPRIETPSSLPTFKVRKEKLGDRVTALQQLVSPFGKTDTASVLHEAIEHIKLLHGQVAVLSAPYLKNGSPPLQRQQTGDKIMDQQESIKDLKSRGLCLVPISSTFPVAADTTADFWTPTFGGTFR